MLPLSCLHLSNSWHYLKADVPLSKILVTLTWDTSNSDLDLYVKDPSNDYSCYFHKNTVSGGKLDYDITTGYGPEHWTLMSNNVIQYNSPYKIRVHYYRANSSQPATNYVVTVKTNEGTAQEKTERYTGTLSYANSNNDDIGGAGSDWADICSVTLNGPASIASQQIIPQVSVPLPPLKYRLNLKK